MAFANKSDAVKYNNKFIAENYDRISLTVPKGQKELLQMAAVKTGDKTVNTLLHRLINDELARLGIHPDDAADEQA